MPLVSTGRATAVLALAALVASGCSTHEVVAEPSDASLDASDAADVALDAGPSVAMTLGAHVLPNTEQYACSFFALPAEPVFLTGFSHTFSVGYHHLYVFQTDLGTVPAGGGSATDCYAGAASPMTHARASIYAQETPSGSFAFPPGVALPATAGQVLLIQAHYLNATAQPIDAMATLSVDYVSADPGEHAGAFFFYDPFVDVAPERLATATMRCLVPSNVTVLTTVGAAHQRANGYEAFLDPPSAVGPNPYYHAPGWSDPLPLAATLPIAPGSHLRFLCSYDNSGGSTEYLQGTQASTSEQCILSGVYFPELGPAFDACQSADEFGTGTARCSVTNQCIAACPAGAAPPPDLGLGGEPAIDPCWQRCIAASCPDTSALFFSLRACMLAHCASCAGDGGTGGDAGGGCAACALAHCATEAAACSSDPCK